jgi:hypothetical protein
MQKIEFIIIKNIIITIQMNRLYIETEIGLELPSLFEKYEPIVQDNLIKYLKQLDTIERQAYTIGKSHLGSSFNVLKSNGYNDWLKNNN